MEKRSDNVGSNAVFALLHLMYQARGKLADGSILRLTLIGHSFGCKVICSALQRLYQEIASQTASETYRSFVMNTRINAVLIQPCFESSDLDSDGRYGSLKNLPCSQCPKYSPPVCFVRKADQAHIPCGMHLRIERF
jgi:hypothetical protein